MDIKEKLLNEWEHTARDDEGKLHFIVLIDIRDQLKRIADQLESNSGDGAFEVISR